MNNRRKLAVALGATALTAPFASLARQKAKVRRIGFLGVGSPTFMASRAELLRLGLHDLGHVDGRNIVIEARYADGRVDRLAELAAELGRLHVDALVTHTTQGVQAAMQATSTIPIVMAATADPVATGLVASLARPGGNVTGSAILTPTIMAKRMELLKEAAPSIKRVAALLRPNASKPAILLAMETTAKLLQVELQTFELPNVGEPSDSFATMSRNGISGLVIQDDPVIIANSRAIAGSSEKYRIPAIGNSEFAEAGNMLGFGVNIPEMFRRAAYFVDKILKGAKPSDLPVEQPTKFELVINMKASKSLGLKIPQALSVRADKVID